MVPLRRLQGLVEMVGLELFQVLRVMQVLARTV
jgi:hypothetical protein